MSSERSVEDLFRRFRKTGAPRLLAAVYDRVAPELLLLAVHLGRSEGDAEDLLQETFVTAIESAQHWDGSRPLVPWLLGILANRARRLARERARQPDPARLELPDHAADDPLRAAADAEFAEEFARRLAALPRGYREVLTLRWVHGLTPTQIGHSLGLPIDTVKTRLRRGNEILRRALPVGFAAGALATLTPARDLGTVREAVLAAARAARGARAATLTLGPGQAVALVAVLALGAVLAWWSLRAPRGAATERAARGTVASEPPQGVEVTDAPIPLAPPRPARSPVPGPPAGDSPGVTVRFATGEPVAGAVVLVRPRAVADGALRERRLVADAEGRLAAKALEPGRYVLREARGGFAELEVVDGTPPGPLALVVPAGVDVVGRVRDGERPVGAAQVWLSRPGAPDRGVAVATTTADGRFALRAVEPGRALSVLADRYSPRPLVRLPAAAGETVELDLDLANERSAWALAGRVVDAAGQPVAGAHVQLGRRLPGLDFDAVGAGDDARAPPIELVSDASGRFARRGFTTYGGVLEVWARAPGSAAWYAQVPFTRPTLQQDVQIELAAGRALIGVARGEDGQPIAEVTVTAAPAAATDLAFAPAWALPSAVTDAGGSFALDGIAPGVAFLTATAPDGRRAVETLDDPGAPRWDPVLRAPRALSGFVVDPRGAPIAGLLVRGLVDGGRSEPPPARSDERGAFTLADCDELTHTLWITDPASPWDGSVFSLPGVRALDSPVFASVPDHLRSSAALAGRFVDEDGRPIVADLALGNLRAGRTFARGAADGTFRIAPLPALDHWDLFLRDDHGRWGCLAELTTEPGATTDLGDVQLRQSGRVAVRATVVGGGAPAQAFAKLTTRAGLICDAVQLVDGVGRSGPLPPGDYVVTFGGDVALNPTPVVVPAGAAVAITPELVRGEPVVVELAHPDDGWDLRARLTWLDAAGSVVARDFVQLPRGRPARFAQRLPAGAWGLRVEAHSGRSATVPIAVPASQPVVVPLVP
ncbi:MAG: sigma-70 family RNA polymerase sigma factor [Planctomycetes bacterium]|nr:sigma-70 family RNA polymerase sigma factor [Planctomycetota bacterium]